MKETNNDLNNRDRTTEKILKAKKERRKGNDVKIYGWKKMSTSKKKKTKKNIKTLKKEGTKT